MGVLIRSSEHKRSGQWNKDAVNCCNCSLCDMSAHNPFRVSHSIDRCNNISCLLSSQKKGSTRGINPGVPFPSAQRANYEAPPVSRIRNSNNPYDYIILNSTHGSNPGVPSAQHANSEASPISQVRNSTNPYDFIAPSETSHNMGMYAPQARATFSA
jgi:hypothetical protein